jgi:hypothetical protein
MNSSLEFLVEGYRLFFFHGPDAAGFCSLTGMWTLKCTPHIVQTQPLLLPDSQSSLMSGL